MIGVNWHIHRFFRMDDPAYYPYMMLQHNTMHLYMYIQVQVLYWNQSREPYINQYLKGCLHTPRHTIYFGSFGFHFVNKKQNSLMIV